MEILVMHLVKHVPPLPTPPLSNAPLVPIKQLQPVMQVILGLPVMHLVKHVLMSPTALALLVLLPLPVGVPLLLVTPIF